MSTRSLLLEIGTEEMPSAPLNNAVKQLATIMAAELDAAGLAHGAVRIVSSPRRLAALVSDVAEATEPVHEVKRGPAAAIAFDDQGAPTKAAEGFARKCGVEATQLVRREDVDGREYVFAEIDAPSVSALDLLPRACEQAIARLEWPNYRSQRWGVTQQTFVRPIRWICCLFGEQAVHLRYADVESGLSTQGHRVLAPGPHAVARPEVYEEVLKAAFVLLEDERRAVITQAIAELEAQRGAKVATPPKVLDEVVNLCEWPTVLTGTFDEEFLLVPPEIICESMLSNQRYFPIYDAEGKLTREFVIVGNGRPACAATIVDGNERVVRARLSDAAFFYEEDLKVPLEEFRSRLASVAFHDELGSVLEKSERLEALAACIASEADLPSHQMEYAVRAAHLCKADLVSSAVVEFTSQQGVMGGYYARAAGEADAVADAIRDHYRPRFAGDELPFGIEGCVVAVADKLDTIAGMFAIGQPPTGSKDPYALRRAAIGIINILRDRLGCSYEPLVDAALEAYARQGLSFNVQEVAQAVCAFIHGRMEQMAREEHIAPDTVAAVSAGPVSLPADFFALCHSLEAARAHDPKALENLAIAFARANNLREAHVGTQVNKSLLGPEEAALYQAIGEAKARVDGALAVRDFTAALASLAELRAPIDAFFEAVKVIDDDVALRENRLRLLNTFVATFACLADFCQLSKRASA